MCADRVRVAAFDFESDECVLDPGGVQLGLVVRQREPSRMPKPWIVSPQQGWICGRHGWTDDSSVATRRSSSYQPEHHYDLATGPTPSDRVDSNEERVPFRDRGWLDDDPGLRAVPGHDLWIQLAPADLFDRNRQVWSGRSAVARTPSSVSRARTASTSERPSISSHNVPSGFSTTGILRRVSGRAQPDCSDD